jgi:hypothetical protein
MVLVILGFYGVLQDLFWILFGRDGHQAEWQLFNLL